MEYEVSETLWEERENRFTYHKPFGDQEERYVLVRRGIARLAHLLDSNCPPSRELSIAMTKLDEVMFFSNASIARTEVEETELGEE